MLVDNTVIVYSPDGEAERHTRANARDLINGAGYTWVRGVATTPASIAPFVTFDPPAGPVPSQKVLDSVGGSASNGSNAAAAAAAAQAAEAERIKAALATQQNAAPAAPVAPVAPEGVKDFSAAPVVDASDLDADADAEAETDADTAAEEAPARRRGRPPRNA